MPRQYHPIRTRRLKKARYSIYCSSKSADLWCLARVTTFVPSKANEHSSLVETQNQFPVRPSTLCFRVPFTLCMHAFGISKRHPHVRRDAATAPLCGDLDQKRQHHGGTQKQKCFFPSVETANRRRLGAVKVRLVSKQLSDVGDAVLDHGGPLEAQPPSDHAHILNGGKEHHEKKKQKNKGNGRRSLVICTGLELL